MRQLKLEADLEACSSSYDTQEIADFIEAHNKWEEYVARANKTVIMEDTENEYIPEEAWNVAQSFHPNDLITEACNALGWESIPDDLSIIMNFSQIIEKSK